MKHARLRGRLRSGLLACVLALAPGCARDATSPGQMPDGLPAGIYPLVAVAEIGDGAVRVELYLRRVDVPAAVAGYQGELAYDTGVMELEAAQVPAGIVGSTHHSPPGRIHFSGAAAQGVGDAPALTLVFRRRGRIDRQAFTVTLDEVTGDDLGDLTGLAVSGTPYLATR